MKHYTKYRLLAFLLGFLIVYSYSSFVRSKENTGAIVHPSPTSKTLPKELKDVDTWPVISLCDDKSGYTLFYQLEDGSNIYKDQKGGFIRAKKVRCTN